MSHDLVNVASAPEQIDSFSCLMTVAPSGPHNGCIFCP
ncbi:phage tail protein, partial [Salmonella enterica subsp. enterica serovar Wilhelmsburg]